MAQLFHPSFNTIAKATILGGIFIAAAVSAIAAGIYKSPYLTEQYVARQQPVPFSHQHHVGGLGIDCRYCHYAVETSPFAGMPSTKTCMTCHSQIWTNAEMLAPVRDSWRSDKPIIWNRVHDLPDYVQFNHSVHVAKGVGCVSCHGRVDQMPLMWKTQSLYMEWCLSCHRAPEKQVRPRSEVFNLEWTWESEGKDASVEGPKLLEKYKIATWEYPVHNRAAANPHGSVDSHGSAAVDAHAAMDPHTVPSDGRTSSTDQYGASPAAKKAEFTPNPLTNCSVCHY